MTSPISIGVEIVVDDAEPGFKKFGNEDYWHSWTYPKAVGGSMQWTFGVIKLENYGLWCPELPCSGLYEVYVHIPNTHATIEDACYRVHCQEGTLPQIVGTPIPINQAKARDDWARLGLFWFDSGGEDCVSLVDVTEISPPDGGSFYVGFDAMRWVLRDFSP